MVQQEDNQGVVRETSSKAEKARAKFQQAALRLMNDCSYRDLKINSLAKEAGVANGLFYHYYKGMNELVAELVDDFISRHEAVEEIEKDIAKGDWFGRILAHYRLVVDTYADYPGIVRCVRHLGEDNRELRERWSRSYHKQLHWLVDALPRVFPGVQLEQQQAELLVYGLGSVGEQVVWGCYIDKDPQYTGLKLSREQMAEWLAAIYYRGLFAANPPADQLEYADVLRQLERR